MKTTKTFKSRQTKKTWNIFHNANCKAEYAIFVFT